MIKAHRTPTRCHALLITKDGLSTVPFASMLCVCYLQRKEIEETCFRT